MRRLLLALSLLLVGFVPPQDTAPTYEVPAAPVLSIWSEEPSMAVEILHTGRYVTNDTEAGHDSLTMQIINYAHPGGALLVFYRGAHGTVGWHTGTTTVTFNGTPLTVIEQGISTINRAQLGMAFIDNVAAATANITVTTSQNSFRRGVMAYSLTEGAEIYAHEMVSENNASPSEITVNSGTNDLVLSAVSWWASSATFASGTGQTREIDDNSPTRMLSDSKNGAATSTDLEWTITGDSMGHVKGVVALRVAASGVTLTAPADTTTQTQPITFSWEAEAGAGAYQLQIATDSAFTSIVHDDDTLTTTSKEVSGLAASTLHYWRVRADI